MPLMSVTAAAGTAQSASSATTMYVTRNAYTFTKKNGKMVKGDILKTGASVKGTEGKYYLLSTGKYILKDCVGSIKLYKPSAKAKNAGTGITVSKSEGKVFNIYCWNDEFKIYFENYYTPPKGIEVNWIIEPTYDGLYQQKFDEALANQKNAAADDKIDLFLAEPDYLCKYVDSKYTMDVSKIGVKPYTTEYEYAYTAATDKNGKLKGVGYTLCPGALIYRRSIAEEVLGTSDPDKVQAKLNTWDKFNSAAEKAKEKGYYMTVSFAETYRAFTCVTAKPLVSSKNKITVTKEMNSWLDQTEKFLANDYTLMNSLWSAEKSDEMYDKGRTMCFFGPSWYYNFCMGGTWLLAAEGSDNPEMLADVMNAFTANTKICTRLAKEDGLFVNNTSVNDKIAKDKSYGNEFLGGQNDYAVLTKVAKSIKYKNKTVYDYYINELFPYCMLDYIDGRCSKDATLNNFCYIVTDAYPKLKKP